jgi:hypothetical protein
MHSTHIAWERLQAAAQQQANAQPLANLSDAADVLAAHAPADAGAREVLAQ